MDNKHIENMNKDIDIKNINKNIKSKEIIYQTENNYYPGFNTDTKLITTDNIDHINEYDNNGKLIKKTVYYGWPDGRWTKDLIIFINFYEYGANGNVTKIINYEADEKTIREFSTDGLIKETRYYDGEIRNINLFYDGAKRSEKITFLRDGEIIEANHYNLETYKTRRNDLRNELNL